MCMTFMLAYLDKITLNFANAYSLQRDLGMTGNDYSWVAAITNIGYLAAALPANLALQKFPISKFLGISMAVWGSILTFTALAQNFAGLMALRFLLGAIEACIAPAAILLTNIFWTRQEAPFRMSCYLGWDGIGVIFGAGLAYGLRDSHGVLSPWQLIFLIIGIITVCYGIIIFLFVPSSQLDCKFFTRAEKVVAVWRIASNHTGVGNPKIQRHQTKETFKDPKFYIILFQGLCSGILNSAVANFQSALFKGFGYDVAKSTLYQMPGGALELVAVPLAGYITSCIPNSLVITFIFGLIPGIAGMIGIATIPINHHLALAACTWLQPIFGVALFLTWTLIGSNVAGHTKRSMFIGGNFVTFGAGNAIGPFFFLPKEAPRYLTAIKTLAGTYGALVLLTATLGVLMWLANKRRDKEGEVDANSDEQGFLDQTDWENKGFRYTL